MDARKVKKPASKKEKSKRRQIDHLCLLSIRVVISPLIYHGCRSCQAKLVALLQKKVARNGTSSSGTA
jgi:hypothetical protein